MKFKIFSESLRARLFMLTLLACLPGFVVATLDSIDDVHQEKQIALSTVQTALERVQFTYNSMVLWADDDLGDIAGKLNGSEQTCPATFKKFMLEHAEYERLGLIDDNGKLLCALTQPGRTAQVPSKELTQLALQGASDHVATSLQDSGEGGSPQLLVMRQVPGTASRKLLVYLAMDFKPLQKITPSPLMDAARVTFINPAGKIIATRHGITDPHEQSSMHQPYMERTIKESTRSDLVASLPLGQHAVAGTIQFYLPSRLVYHHANTALIENITLLLADLLLVSAALWWFGYRLILKPAQSVMHTIAALSMGHLGKRTGITRGTNEITRIALALDRMAENHQDRERERKLHLILLERSNRLHRALASIRETLAMRLSVELTRDRICKILCQTEDILVTWIGEVDPEAKLLRVVSRCGPAHLFEGETALSLDPDLPGGNGPAATAAREDKEVVTNHYPAGTQATAWQRHCAGGGIRSVAAFPMGFAGPECRRVLVIGSKVENYFSAEEIHMLKELTEVAAIGLQLITTEQTLNFANTHDPVTTLVNAALLRQRLHDELHRSGTAGKIVMVAVLDVEYQHVISAWGAERADALLKRVANETARVLGGLGFVGALPGARFGLVIGNLETIQQGERQIDFVLNQLRTTQLQWRDDPLISTLRIGVSVFPMDAKEAPVLLDKAATALTFMDASRSESIRYFDPKIELCMNEEREIERELGHAIDRGELVLHYQPILNLTSGLLFGFEALLRWRHPRLGNLSPDRFIPLAERSGLIHLIGEWVVKEAARQAMAWDNHTSDELVITVNVSTVQMNDPQFYQRVRDQVRVLGNSQHKVRLAMEITESQMIQNLDRSIRLLEDIRALGISIVIDDFGTGYSSLSYLHRLPVDILKIDKSFTESIDTRSKERMIVEGIIALAGTLQLRTIAEGIEREAQMDIVKKMGGTFAQGYLIDRALSAADVEQKWLHAAI